MARIPFPWFWEERAEWCVNIRGERIKLGPHPDGFDKPRKRQGKWNPPLPILQAFHALMAQSNSPTARSPDLIRPTNFAGPFVGEILDKFLDWCKKNRAERTFEWYRDHIQSFLNSLANPASMLVTDLKPFHVIEWTDENPDWSPAYKRGAIIAVQRPFNWAEELGYFPTNPIKKVKKPTPQRRENPISPDDFTTILGLVKESDPFRDLLLFSWYTGCRPQEARHIEPRHVQLPNECIVIPKDEAKGKRRARVIFLHGPSLEIVKRLISQRREQKLFVNSDGASWTKTTLCNRFGRLKLAIGMKTLRDLGITVPKLQRFNRRNYSDKESLMAARMEHEKLLRQRRKEINQLARKHGKNLAAYDLRHGFCQRLLENGASTQAVAELMGHTNGNMVNAVYSHMNQATGHLKETLKKASSNAST